MSAAYQRLPSGVYVRAGYKASHDFTDGAEAEARIRQAVEKCPDRSVGSLQLLGQIQDWPSFYHLSPRRSNLLRAVEELLGDTVLEIGCGCGALTRYLGETGRHITAIDASETRAAIAARRCGDLPNVAVYADELELFQPGRKFAAVVCVGVLEYAPVFFDGPNPIETALEKIAGLMDEKGVLLIGIENQLGLRYLAGSPEDHHSEPYYGIEDRYRPGEPVTLGWQSWKRLLSSVGFRQFELLVPFPDYKAPQVICSARAFEQPLLPLHHVVGHALRTPFQDHPQRFLESAAWPVVLRNGLAEGLANSFLIVASRSADVSVRPRALVYYFSDERLPAYAKITMISEIGGALTVSPRALYPAAQPPSDEYRQSFHVRPFIAGEPYDTRLAQILKRAGWRTQEISEWAKPWLQYLREQALADTSHDDSEMLPGSLLDCSPFNIVIGGDQQWEPFDLEYEAPGPIPLGYVAFRGLWSSLFRLSRYCASPSEDIDGNLLDLTMNALRSAGLPLSEQPLESYILREARFQELITGIDAAEAELLIREARLMLPPKQQNPGEVPFDRIQVFWRFADSDFEEGQSHSHACVAGSENRTEVVKLPAFHAPPVALRLDPADRPGILEDFRVSVYDGDGQRVWSLGSMAAQELLAAKMRDLLFLRLPAEDAPALALLTGSDPCIEIPIPPNHQSQLGNGRVEVGFRRVLVSPEFTEMARKVYRAEAGRLHAALESSREDAARVQATLDSVRSVLATKETELDDTRRELDRMTRFAPLRFAAALRRFFGR
jgi:SAM-dependent methyltransferase